MKADVIVLAASLLVAAPLAAQDRVVRYDIGPNFEMTITTDVIVDTAGAREYRHTLATGGRGAAKAVDRATGKPLATRTEGPTLIAAFAAPLPPRAEQRIGIEETAAAASAAGDRLVFSQTVNGRVVVALPPGFAAQTISLPAQYFVEGGRAKVGVLALDGPQALRIEAIRAGAPTDAALPRTSTFRADDERTVTYWLQQPQTQQFKLALELRLTSPGQRHVYSVTRKEDNITEPSTLDVDRGVMLPTRLIPGTEANALGDALSEMANDASVFVADLGYAVPAGGSARVRLFQTATDKAYQLMPDGSLRWVRFLARLRTRIVLPDGWVLTSMDQPARISKDEAGRTVLDFQETAGSAPDVVLTARKAAGAAAAAGRD